MTTVRGLPDEKAAAAIIARLKSEGKTPTNIEYRKGKKGGVTLHYHVKPALSAALLKRFKEQPRAKRKAGAPAKGKAEVIEL